MNNISICNTEKHNRKSIRLPEFDYSQEGFYFVTKCCQDMVCRFGSVVDGKMVLNECGRITKESWEEIPIHFPEVQLHAFVIMPNHVHGIIEITENVGAKQFSPNIETDGAKDVSPLQIQNTYVSPDNETDGAKQLSPLRSPSKTIGSIVRGYKIGVTKWVRQNTNIHKLWQRNYYEHVIRNDHSFNQITEFILTNPLKWEFDKFYHL